MEDSQLCGVLFTAIRRGTAGYTKKGEQAYTEKSSHVSAGKIL
jgi:hypothetical protein